MFALIPLMRHLFVIVVFSIFLFFFSIGQALIYGTIIFTAIGLGIAIYYIVTKNNHINKFNAIIFAICVSAYVLISFLSHLLFVNNQDIEFVKDILTGLELPFALTLISESSTESVPKNAKPLARVNDKLNQLLTMVDDKNIELLEVSNRNAKPLADVNDKLTQLLTIVNNKNNESSPKNNDKNIELLTENNTRKTVQPRRILQVKKLHKNNRLTNIKR